MTKAQVAQAYVHAKVLRGMLDVAQACRLNRRELLQAIELDPRVLDAPDSAVAIEFYYALTAAISSYEREPDIGLYIGRLTYLENIHLNIYMASASETLRDWLNLMPSVRQLFGDIGEVRVRSAADSFALEWHPNKPAGEGRCLTSDSLASATVLQMNSFCLLPLRPLRVDLCYSKPASLQGLHQFLGDNLHFDQGLTAVHYPRSALDYPLARVNTRIYDGAAEEFARLYELNSTEPDSFLLGLHAAIRAQLPRGECSIENIARSLHVSRRTLQRRLHERDTNFQQLLQEIKAGLARKYLRDARLSIIQIALLLGYADHSTFSAAFKTWEGMTPSEFRNRSTP